MNFLASLFMGGLNIAGRGLKHPMAAGGAIGAGVGFFGSDGSITQRLGDAGETALAGAAIGALMPISGAGLYSQLWKHKSFVGKAAWNTAKTAGRLGLGLMENAVPLAAAGVGLYGATKVLGTFGQTGRSPTMEGVSVRTDYNQQAMQAEEMNSMFVNTPGIMGAAPQYREQIQRFQNSTTGLVQGLHRSRH